MTGLSILRVLTFYILVIAAAAAAATADNSNSADILLLKTEISHPLDFCNFYLSA